MLCALGSCHSENGEFFCENENCIAQVLRCDKLDNCGDNSDEKNCIYEDGQITFSSHSVRIVFVKNFSKMSVLEFLARNVLFQPYFGQPLLKILEQYFESNQNYVFFSLQ